jgi:hypothetical protein
MAVTYNLGKNIDVDRAGVYTDLARFFDHCTALDVVLQNFQLKPDGTILIQVASALPPEQIPHLGLVP